MDELIEAIWHSEDGQSIRDIIQRLQQHGADLNTPNPYGRTPAHLAAQKGHAEAIAALGVAGANLNEVDHYGRTPAHLAAHIGHVGAIAALHAAGANLDAADPDGQTPAHLAVQYDHVEAIAALDHAGANLNAVNFEGLTPTHLAVQYGHLDALDALCDAGANLDAADRHGQTPAHLAAHMGHAAALADLHAAGANLNAADRHGMTPAHMAAHRGHSGAISALHAAGAELDAVGGFRNETPADRAAASGHHALADALISHREGSLMGKLNQALSDSTDRLHNHLAIDLRCPISLTPYTTRAGTRPVRLPDGRDAHTGLPIQGSVMSAESALRCMQPAVAGVHGRPPPTDPLTRHVFTEERAQAFLASDDFRQGDPDRLALVAAMWEACRQTDQSPAALLAAAAAAAAPAAPAEAQAVATAAAAAPLDFRAILAAQGSGAAAGSPGGAGPRNQKSCPTCHCM